MKETTKGRQNGIQWTPWLQLDDLDFADDLLLLSHATRQMQDKTDDLNRTSKKVTNMHVYQSVYQFFQKHFQLVLLKG